MKQPTKARYGWNNQTNASRFNKDGLSASVPRQVRIMISTSGITTVVLRHRCDDEARVRGNFLILRFKKLIPLKSRV
ncbi:hypothetical protein FNH22_15810 [Fulvivirga sp. M361]|uniref:hypothetical protein n=1 Tax=Fulvivirga sp. M361 TaxID=2594266 RepID=UPI00117A3CB9|nr:hypothetical protein [Fulvivirga sp. M361]TRX57603.1 hypothetical protein FNH22_15810 [Fulvivirga sp. M361]